MGGGLMKPDNATINRPMTTLIAGILFASNAAALADSLRPQASSAPLTTSSLDAPTAAAAQANSSAPPTQIVFNHPMPACLVEIAKATVVEDGTLTGAKSRASLLAAEKLGAGAREELLEMIGKVTPAGRLLSLALLRKIDPNQYQKFADALNSEMGDQSVLYISPSERCHYNVADILNDMSSSHPLIKMLP